MATLKVNIDDKNNYSNPINQIPTIEVYKGGKKKSIKKAIFHLFNLFGGKK